MLVANLKNSNREIAIQFEELKTLMIINIFTQLGYQHLVKEERISYLRKVFFCFLKQKSNFSDKTSSVNFSLGER